MDRIGIGRALIAAAVLCFLWWWPVPHVATRVAVEKSPERKAS